MRVNVAPDMGMYRLLVSQNYDPAYALAEFIDNAIHAYVQSPARDQYVLEIAVDFHSSESPIKALRNSIAISDNGPGIPTDRLSQALKPAMTPEQRGLSEFGIGMKAAAVWFADVWQLQTCPTGEGIQHTVVFDLEDLLTSGEDEVEVRPEPYEGASGTTIRLTRLRRDVDRTRYLSIVQELTDIFQRFIGGEDAAVEIVASYNGVPSRLQFDNPPPDPLESPEVVVRKRKRCLRGQPKRWSLPVDFTFQDFRVAGFIMIREVGSYKKNPGIVLFRHDRVIRGTRGNASIPEGIYSTSNKARGMLLYGELDIDEGPVTYTKDSFTFADADFSAALITHTPGLRELLRQVDNYRKELPPCEDSGTEAKDASTDGKDLSEGRPGDSSSSDEREEQRGDTGGGKKKARRKSDLKHKIPTRIPESDEIVARLNAAGNLKLSRLYHSLCTISLKEHSILAYVGAWSFFEALAARLGSNVPFASFIMQRCNNWYGKNKGKRLDIRCALERLQDEGNLNKHSGRSYTVEGSQLVVDFHALEPVICRLLEELQAMAEDTGDKAP